VGIEVAIIGAALAGAAGSVVAGKQQSKAIKNAANINKQSQTEAIDYQQKARDDAKAILSKYAVEGDAARGRQNAFLGLGQPQPAAAAQPQTPSQGQVAPPIGYSGALGRGGAMDARDVAQPVQRNRYGGGRPDTMTTLGQVEGGPLQMAQPPAPNPTQTPGETQEQAWAAFEASPWGRIGTMEAEQARDNFIASAGAQGSALSGRTARGMAEVSEEAKLRNFGGYYGALGDVTNRGFSADAGIASGGQQFANNAANITLQAGQNAGELAIAKGQNNANTTNDLASWIGWGMGQVGGMGGGTAGSTMYGGGSGASSAGRARSGGLRSRIT
jgi:hypothetical protein